MNAFLVFLVTFTLATIGSYALVTLFNHYRWRRMFRKAREARSKYYLTQEKEKE